MEANLNTQPTAPGDESQFMHTFFSSDEEMLMFYFTMNRFINPVTYNMQCTDVERLEDIRRVLGQFANSLFPLETYQFDGIKCVVEGLAMYMLKKTGLSTSKRLAHAETVGAHLQFVMKMAAGVASAKRMCNVLHSHIQNVDYLIEKFKTAASDK